MHNTLFYVFAKDKHWRKGADQSLERNYFISVSL